MSEILKKFSEAAKTVSANNNPMKARVYGAYRDQLRNINSNDLPDNIQIIYESVIDRLRSAKPVGDIGEDEAEHLAIDIIHMANVVKANIDP